MKEQVNQARWIAVLAATAIALYVCWLMLKPFIGVLEWAVVLAIVFYPVHKRLAKRIRRRGLSALISSLLVILIVLLPLTFLTVALTNELSNAARNLPQHVNQLMESQPPVIGRVSRWIQDHLAIETQRSQEFVAVQLENAAAVLVGQSLGIMGNILSGFLKTFFVIFTMYYLFRDGDKIVAALPAALPLRKNQSDAIIARATEVISAGVYGVVTIAAIQGLLGGLAFWVLGVPSPILWGVLMTFVCMIPIAGSFFIWLPLAIYLMITGHWTKAIFLVLWGALIISTIDNFLRPKLIKNQTKLHELFVFFSVLGGMRLFGLLGIILGPVVLAITIGLINTFSRDDRAAENHLDAERSSLPSDTLSHRTAALARVK
ncbi:MAG TPA: AI-2E family transporter [Pyrinomonadaceae bacterium]|nr:AI-2E family transporter [Pyrinomonadaceae bacterium]